MNEKWELIGKQGTAIWCGDEIIAQVTQPRVDHGKKRKRAQLMAAAPDLLENLIGCMEALASYAPDCIEVECARAAILKVTGA